MSKRRGWPAIRWGVLAIALVAMNLAAAAWVLKTSPTMAAAWANKTGTAMVGLPDVWISQSIPSVFFHEGLDGSWVKIELDPTTRCPSDWSVAIPATRWGLFLTWVPAVASGAITLLTLVLAPSKARRWLIQRIRVARISMLQGMAAIGAISLLLWLGRLDLGLTFVGAIVLPLLAHAAWRGGFLVKEIRSEGTKASALSRAGLVGYSLAAPLALAWVVCIFIWDVLMQSCR